MILSDFITLVQRSPHPVLLLEGTRELPPDHAPRLTSLAARLVRSLPTATFRSGNAPGSDEMFLHGLTEAHDRVELITPHEGHRNNTTPVRKLSLRDASPATLRELIRISIAATPRYTDFFDRYLGDRLPPDLKAKARYLLRDTLKIHGCPQAGLAPATAALLYLNPEDPDKGGTGHTRRVCKMLNVPVLSQDTWIAW